MKSIPMFFGALGLALFSYSCGAQSSDPGASLDALAGMLGSHSHGAVATRPLTMPEAMRIALEENPEIHLAARRIRMAESHVPGVGALEDPQLMYRGWGVPLVQPWNYNVQNMLMVGQTLPGPGKRAMRTGIAQSDVTESQIELEMTRLRVRVAVRQAFYDMLRAQDELRIHDQHAGIARQAIEAAKIKYTVGKVPQVEILKAQLALARLAEHMVHFEQDSSVARARLNTLMGRDADAGLEVLGESTVGTMLPALSVLEATALEHRPDLLQAAAAAEKSRREQGLAKKAYVPDFNLAAGYMLMPPGSGARNTYAVEGSMNLPWLNHRKHDAELAEAAAGVNEKDAELAMLKNAARGEIQIALVRAEAAQQLARFYSGGLRTQAENALHAAVVAYENDQTTFLDLLDSQMTVVDIDLQWIDAIAEFNSRIADLEMTTGATVTPTTDEEMQ